jgi:hypothetical protein
MCQIEKQAGWTRDHTRPPPRLRPAPTPTQLTPEVVDRRWSWLCRPGPGEPAGEPDRLVSSLTRTRRLRTPDPISAGQPGRVRPVAVAPECMTRRGSASCHCRARSRGEPGGLTVTHATGAGARPGHHRASVAGGHRDPTYKADVGGSSPPRPPLVRGTFCRRCEEPANGSQRTGAKAQYRRGW